MRLLGVTLVALFGCPAPKPPKPPPPPADVRPPGTPPPTITWQRVVSPGDVPTTPLDDKSYRVHLIDVGTGLAIFVQGARWNLLYDAGTNDPQEKPQRVLAYLGAAMGVEDPCTKHPVLSHIVLSHPHLDHASALEDIVRCFDIGDIWDSGRVNDAAFYRDFLLAVGSSTAKYHTAASVPVDHVVGVKGEEIKIANWERFSEGDKVELDANATFTILHAEAKKLPDPNQNSLVISVQLGTARMLLVGDAESGDRKDPSYPPGDVEQFLIEQHPNEIRSDILQVGHHGSKTSSRRGFLEAVGPTLALVSSGPKQYGKVTLPDREVIDELARIGAAVLRTDTHDTNCDAEKRIGPDEGPGGCDSYVISISSSR